MNYIKWAKHFEKENQETTWTYGIFQKLIEEHCSAKEDLILVEVGVARGGHARHLLNNFDKFKLLYGIDPHSTGYDDSDSFSKKSQEEFNYLHVWVNQYCSDKRFKLIRSTSEYVAPSFEDESIDAIYIDGDHTYNGCKKDIEQWLPKVKKGGLIAGDDFSRYFPGTVKAVQELVPNASTIGQTWYWRKI
jgi:predicted O-methyltransferase YrrM